MIRPAFIKRSVMLITLVIMGLTSYGQTIDTTRSEIRFEVSNMAVRTVEGSLDGFSGTVVWNEDDLASSYFDVCVDAATIFTDNKKRDKHLRNEDFFHVEKFPTICFTSERIERDALGNYKAVGKVSMLGVSKAETIVFTVEDNTLKGTMFIDRTDYDLGAGTGKFMVGHQIDVAITCVLQ